MSQKYKKNFKAKMPSKNMKDFICDSLNMTEIKSFDKIFQNLKHYNYHFKDDKLLKVNVKFHLCLHS